MAWLSRCIVTKTNRTMPAQSRKVRSQAILRERLVGSGVEASVLASAMAGSRVRFRCKLAVHHFKSAGKLAGDGKCQLGNVAGYGLYNHAIPEGVFTFRGHGGALMGALSEMAYLSDAGRGYAVMINSGNGHALLRIAKLIRAYLVRDLTPPPLPSPGSRSPCDSPEK